MLLVSAYGMCNCSKTGVARSVLKAGIDVQVLLQKKGFMLYVLPYDGMVWYQPSFAVRRLVACTKSRVVLPQFFTR